VAQLGEIWFFERYFVSTCEASRQAITRLDEYRAKRRKMATYEE
jgi:hypothetical protein